MATSNFSKKTFSERLSDSYEHLGHSGQLTLYAQGGAGTLERRPHVNPLSGANEKHSPAFTLMQPRDIRVRWYDFKESRGGDLYDFLKETQGEGYARSVLLGHDDKNNGTVRPSPPVKIEPAPPTKQKQDKKIFALKIWDKSRVADESVKTYLHKRGIDIPLPDTIRVNGDVMVSKVVDLNGDFLGIQRTWLKIKNKKMLGPVSGGSVHLAEPVDGKIAITEGIETGLSVQQATGIPTWAALSTSGMVKIQLPTHVKEVWIYADSDIGYAGQKAAIKLATRLKEEGRTVYIVYPANQPENNKGHAPKIDFNDLLVYDKTGQLIRDRLEVTVEFTVSLPPPPYTIKDKDEVEAKRIERGLIPGVGPVFNAKEALDAHYASKKLEETIHNFFEDVDKAIRTKEASNTVKAAREESLNQLYDQWLKDNPEWREPKPPEDVRAKLAYASRKVIPIYTSKNIQIPRLQIRATAGLGKTQAVIDALIKGEWPNRNIDYHVPTINLALELEEEAIKKGLKVQVIQGRKSENCIKSVAAREAGVCGLNVMSSLCEEGQIKCSNFSNCLYLAQFNNQEPCLRIFTHDLLFIPRSSRLPEPDLIIVDENIVIKSVGQTSFHPDRLDDDGQAAVREHLDNGTPIKEALIINGVTKEIAIQKAKQLDEEVKIFVHPNMPESMALNNIAKLRKKSNRAAASFWRQANREWDFDRPFHGIDIDKNAEIQTEDGKELQNRAYVMYRKTIKRSKNVPVLMIDADSNIKINRLLFGNTMQEVEIRAKLNTHVIQTHSSVFTKMSMLTDKKLMNKIKELIQEEVSLADGGGVLVVTNKKVRELITGKSACDDFGKPTISDEYCGASITHFGAILGVDRWKDHKTIIVLGREQPWPQQVERITRALYWDSEEPLNLPGEYTREKRGYQLKGDQQLGVVAQVHPDPNVQQTLELIREHQSGQAISRLRMVHSSEQKRVIIMSNLPLDVEVDELVTAKELFAGGSPLMRAWKELPGVMPLSAPWLANRFSGFFGSHDTANRLISDKIKMTHFSYNLHMETASFKFRLAGSRGKPMKCLSIHDEDTTRLHLEQLFGKKVVSIVQMVEDLPRQVSPLGNEKATEESVKVANDTESATSGECLSFYDRYGETMWRINSDSQPFSEGQVAQYERAEELLRATKQQALG